MPTEERCSTETQPSDLIQGYGEPVYGARREWREQRQVTVASRDHGLVVVRPGDLILLNPFSASYGGASVWEASTRQGQSFRFRGNIELLKVFYKLIDGGPD